MKKLIYPSLNYNERLPQTVIEYIILHATEVDFGQSLQILTDSTSPTPVSCHYLVDENGAVYKMVDESYRAWHAGESIWKGRKNLNSSSIGIEIVNIPGNSFPQAQMVSVADLCQDIMKRHKIPPENVLAHSDIALGRKNDPGALFDWQYLAKKGIGLYPILSPEEIQCARKARLDSSKNIITLQEYLHQIGYGIQVTGEKDIFTDQAIRAFQLKFMPFAVTAAINQEILALLERYCYLLSKESI